MWFSSRFPDLPAIEPLPDDRFILDGHNLWCLVLRDRRVIGYCRVRATWPGGIVATDGLKAVRRLSRR
jgi:hypothetical protein